MKKKKYNQRMLPTFHCTTHPHPRHNIKVNAIVFTFLEPMGTRAFMYKPRLFITLWEYIFLFRIFFFFGQKSCSRCCYSEYFCVTLGKKIINQFLKIKKCR